jgi:bifunctional non-homologous end joining protein LigD
MAGINSSTWRLSGRAVRVSHLDKLYWPEDQLTKGDLLAYYRDVASVMLPHLKDRPATLRVFPDGIHGESYYQREVPQHAPRWFRTTEYTRQTDGRTIRVPLIDNAAGLIWLVNKGSIELHPWSSRLPDLDEPDQAVFDLDPGDEASFADVLQSALHLRDELERQGLRGYAKTSGRRGLHVHLPLAPGHRYDEVRSWVKAVAQSLETTHGEIIAVARGATHVGRRVTIDYAQNSIARSMAAVYTVRAAREAPVAAPVSWDEVAAGRIRPRGFTLRTMPQRIQEVGDLFAPVLNNQERLPRET